MSIDNLPDHIIKQLYEMIPKIPLEIRDGIRNYKRSPLNVCPICSYRTLCHNRLLRCGRRGCGYKRWFKRMSDIDEDEKFRYMRLLFGEHYTDKYLYPIYTGEKGFITEHRVKMRIGRGDDRYVSVIPDRGVGICSELSG